MPIFRTYVKRALSSKLLYNINTRPNFYFYIDGINRVFLWGINEILPQAWGETKWEKPTANKMNSNVYDTHAKYCSGGENANSW